MKTKIVDFFCKGKGHTCWIVVQTYILTILGFLVAVGVMTLLKYRIVVEPIIISPK